MHFSTTRRLFDIVWSWRHALAFLVSFAGAVFIIHLVIPIAKFPWLLVGGLFATPFFAIGLMIVYYTIRSICRFAVAVYDTEKCEHGLYVNCGECLIKKNGLVAQRTDVAYQLNLLKKRQEKAESMLQDLNNLINSKQYIADELLSISSRQFEQQIEILFRKMGYKTQLTPQTNDFGKDIIIWKTLKEKILVECKQYTNKNVGRPELQKFFSAIKEENAVKGFIVTTSYFTDSSNTHQHVRDKVIELIDKDALTRLIDTYNAPNKREELYAKKSQQQQRIIEMKDEVDSLTRTENALATEIAKFDRSIFHFLQNALKLSNSYSGYSTLSNYQAYYPRKRKKRRY